MVLNEQCGLLVHIETGDGLRDLVKALADTNGGRIHQLQGGRPGIQQGRQRPGGSGEIIKDSHRGGGQLGNGHRTEYRLSDEGQGSLRADEQVLKELDRAIKI